MKKVTVRICLLVSVCYLPSVIAMKYEVMNGLGGFGKHMVIKLMALIKDRAKIVNLGGMCKEMYNVKKSACFIKDVSDQARAEKTIRTLDATSKSLKENRGKSDWSKVLTNLREIQRDMEKLGIANADPATMDNLCCIVILLTAMKNGTDDVGEKDKANIENSPIWTRISQPGKSALETWIEDRSLSAELAEVIVGLIPKLLITLLNVK